MQLYLITMEFRAYGVYGCVVLAKNIYDGLEAAIRGAKGKVAGDDRMKGWNAYLYDDVRNGITRSLRA